MDAGPELQGLLHSGGVVRDATIQKQTAAGMREVLGPKAQGAALISSSSQCAPVTAFKLFSSIAARLGSGGQANYAAANAVMDGMAASLQIQACFIPSGASPNTLALTHETFCLDGACAFWQWLTLPCSSCPCFPLHLAQHLQLLGSGCLHPEPLQSCTGVYLA